MKFRPFKPLGTVPSQYWAKQFKEDVRDRSLFFLCAMMDLDELLLACFLLLLLLLQNFPNQWGVGPKERKY